MRRLHPHIVLATITLFLSALAAAPAQAATYQYWSYFHGDTTAWTMSMEGATYVPGDGTVEGWRYVETTGDEIAPEPRVAPDFASLCGNTAAEAGKKRVGLVVDYGTVDASDTADTLATCVLVDEGADGFAVLQAATTITTDNGMVSCIQGVPSASCDAVPGIVTTSTSETATPSSNRGIVIGILAAVLLLGALVVTRRRRT
jgi:MYXO-CTERM domain-containing protein